MGEIRPGDIFKKDSLIIIILYDNEDNFWQTDVFSNTGKYDTQRLYRIDEIYKLQYIGNIADVCKTQNI
jgi:hypothetical protein